MATLATTAHPKQVKKNQMALAFIHTIIKAYAPNLQYNNLVLLLDLGLSKIIISFRRCLRFIIKHERPKMQSLFRIVLQSESTTVRLWFQVFRIFNQHTFSHTKPDRRPTDAALPATSVRQSIIIHPASCLSQPTIIIPIPIRLSCLVRNSRRFVVIRIVQVSRGANFIYHPGIYRVIFLHREPLTAQTK